MSWAVVIDTGAVEIKPGSLLQCRVDAACADLPGWRIAGLRWVTTKLGKSYIAYIESATRFIAPGSQRTPAAAIRGAVDAARSATTARVEDQ